MIRQNMRKIWQVLLTIAFVFVFSSTCQAHFPIDKALLESAESGDAESLFLVGKFYYEHSVHNSYDKQAISYLSRASEKKHLHASALLAVLYKRLKSSADAKQIFNAISDKLLLSAQNGDPVSQVMMGLATGWNLTIEQDRDQKTTDWYKKAAEQGNTDGQYYLGWRYKEGRGVQKDLNQAFYWFMKAAEQGHFQAQNEVGICYGKGHGVAKSDSNAVNWYYRSAMQGYSWGEYNLGYNYINGKGVSKDSKKGVEWYIKAASQKNLWAMNNLGLCYRDGNGTSKDMERAFALFEDAAWKNYRNAQYNLGRCYENGWGTPRNVAKAIEWYSKAANQGHTKSKEALDWLQ